MEYATKMAILLQSTYDDNPTHLGYVTEIVLPKKKNKQYYQTWLHFRSRMVYVAGLPSTAYPRSHLRPQGKVSRWAKPAQNGWEIQWNLKLSNPGEMNVSLFMIFCPKYTYW